MEVEEKIAPYYPEYSDTDDFRMVINSLVRMVEFELDIPEKMSVQYVRNVFSAYKPKVEDNDS